MNETPAGVSPMNTEALHEVPSLAESVVASREALDPGDVLDKSESAELMELSRLRRRRQTS